jgi:hypothetical protein
MSVVWRYLDPRGQACGSSREFAGRDEAEDWLGESWRRLLASGIESVELLEDDEVVYRMGLREA